LTKQPDTSHILSKPLCFGFCNCKVVKIILLLVLFAQL
jgi:hypothetical protein